MTAPPSFTNAACAGRWWLFEDTTPTAHAEARELCLTACPVLADCRAWFQHLAATNGTTMFLPEGTWAGRLYGARATDRAKPSKAPTRRGSARCGTESGHKRHRRAGEPPCDDCRRAHNAAEVDRARRKREDGAA